MGTGQVTESAYGPVQGYIAKRSAAGTKTDALLNETPQSISVVGEEQVRDQAATTVQEALRYTAGVNADAYGPSIQGDYPRVRGSDVAIYLDGFKLSDPGTQYVSTCLSRGDCFVGTSRTVLGTLT